MYVSDTERFDVASVKAKMAAQLAYQDQMLPKVSRSFALTIPKLPEFLRIAVSNAYLLCRIVDTVEDDPAISATQTKALFEMLLDALSGKQTSQPFAEQASQSLGSATVAIEKSLVEQTSDVVAVFLALPASTQTIIKACVTKMCAGMPDYQPNAQRGLNSKHDFDGYCYFVAGVVGEMLTELFCDYASDINEHRDALMGYSASFGQGLQMTNILKDVWDDLDRGYCWLPRDLYESHGYDLQQLAPEYEQAVFRQCHQALVSNAHGHLKNALRFCLNIPSRHKGIRVFCLWAVGLALPTLKRVLKSPAYYEGQTVKMSKTKAVIVTQLIESSANSNIAQRAIFRLLGRGMPIEAVDGAAYRYAMHQIKPHL